MLALLALSGLVSPSQTRVQAGGAAAERLDTLIDAILAHSQFHLAATAQNLKRLSSSSPAGNRRER